MKKQDIYRSAITDESGEPLGDVEHFSFDVISQTKGPVNPYDGSYNVITGSGNTPFAVLDVPDDSRLEFDEERHEHVLIVPSDGKAFSAEEAYLWFGPDGLRQLRKGNP